jgi:hypothetical protein
MIVFNELRCQRCGRFFKVGGISSKFCPRCFARILAHFRANGVHIKKKKKGVPA